MINYCGLFFLLFSILSLNVQVRTDQIGDLEKKFNFQLEQLNKKFESELQLLNTTLIGEIHEGVKSNKTRCGDWQPFKEEKCFKVFDHVGSYQDAVKTCLNFGSTLVTIQYQEEQDFITKYLKEQKIADNVWIGIKYNSGYKWNDNSELVHQNWAKGFPENKSDECVQLESRDNNFGKWSESMCNKKNLAFCQKLQTWSPNHFQEVLLDTIKNPVPIGFIYVQFPEEKAPVDIWPWMFWNDISNVYAGVFLRANGGEAAEFGKVQDENTPRLIEVDTVYDGDAAGLEINKRLGWGYNVTLPIGSRSPLMYLATYSDSGTGRWASFVTSGGEVRPRNMAIKVWRRMN